MKLKILLKNIYDGPIPSRFKDFDIKSISCDSRLSEPNSLFIALKGTQADGAHFISQAIEKGATVVVGNSIVLSPSQEKNACVLNVDNPRKALFDISQKFYNFPSKKIKTVGVTGTNGKTTITYLIETILNHVGKKCAVIGTVNYRVGKTIISSKNTTPGLLENQQYLAQMVKEKIEYCIMEVSSHALDQGRVDAIDFHAAIFTNLTGDHMDYHKNTENYFEAKAKLFTRLTNKAVAVINQDDVYGKKLVSMTKAEVITYGIEGKSQVFADDVHLDLSGSRFLLRHPKGQIPIETTLTGKHNIYNILAGICVCAQEGISLKDIAAGIKKLNNVPGRLERVDCGQDFSIFVDYAHTEDALKNVLAHLRDVHPSKIIVVFGCGGDRDKTKRPKMGNVASSLSDHVIITSDNPRSEDPQSIIDQIIVGCTKKNYEVISDRAMAIKKALSVARQGDIVLIAGKGHENYQIFKDQTIHFDDREVVKSYFAC